MVSELTWTGQSSQGEIALSLSLEEIRVLEKILSFGKLLAYKVAPSQSASFEPGIKVFGCVSLRESQTLVWQLHPKTVEPESAEAESCKSDLKGEELKSPEPKYTSQLTSFKRIS